MAGLEINMDTERIAWAAFRLYGSIEAYLLHKSVEGLSEIMRNGNGKNKGLDN